MTKTNFNFNQTFNQPITNSNHNFQDFLRQHRFLTFSIIIGLIALLIILLISIFAPNPTPTQEIEDSPYITFEYESVLDGSIQKALSQDILFYLQLIIFQNIEHDVTNPEGKNYIVSFDNNSFFSSTVPSIPYSELYTVNLNVSDNRKYLLRILINNEYHNEYAAAILKRIDQSNSHSQDYIITFTSNTSAYYSTLGTNKNNSSTDSSAIVDYFTGAPLNPLPETATKWIESLDLSNPQTIHATLPSLR